jgi:hypothetical protein
MAMVAPFQPFSGRNVQAAAAPCPADVGAQIRVLASLSPSSAAKEIAGDAAPLGCHPPMDKEHHRASLKSQRENTAATFDSIILCAELDERDGPPILIETGVGG